MRACRSFLAVHATRLCSIIEQMVHSQTTWHPKRGRHHHTYEYLIHKELPAIIMIDHVLQTTCSATSGQPPLFVDSGANDGIWSLMAAQSGCTAVAIEPQLLCMQHIAAAARENGGLAIRAHQNMLGIRNFTARVRTDQCIGTRQFLDSGKVGDAYNVGGTDSEDPCLLQEVPSARLDDLVGGSERIALWHVDTEGAEKLVLESALRLFAEQRIDRVILEWEPERVARYGMSLEDADTFMAGLLLDWSCKRLCSAQPVDWRMPVAPQAPHMDVYCTRPGVADVPLGNSSSGRLAEACSKVAEATLRISGLH
jgi:FkbM family methyltransferase